MDPQRRYLMQLLGAAPFLMGAAKPERLIVCYNDDFAPYSYIDREHGGSAVLGIEPGILDPILHGVAGLAHSNLGLPWRRAQEMVRQGEADALCTFASAERQEYLRFNTVPVCVVRPHLFFSVDHPQRHALERLKSRDALKAFHLVDLKGNQWAEENLADFPRVEWAPSLDAVFRMVISRRRDAHLSTSPLMTKWRIRKLGLGRQYLAVPAPYMGADVQLHFGVRLQHPRRDEILALLDAELHSRVQQRRIEAIFKRYD